MLGMLQFYIQLCFLKQTPQDAPYSKSLLKLGILAYFLVCVMLASFNQTIVVSFVMSFIQMAILIFLTNLLLWIRKTPERYEQTLTALTWTGAIIGMAALPVIMMLSENAGEGAGLSVFLWVGLIIWETMVIGHIYRHSMDISFPAGIGISFVYMYLTFAITLRIVKIFAAPLQ